MRKCVLVVDDEAELTALLRKGLEAGGCEVLAAADGKEGIQKAQSARPDLILLDVVMPGMDGFGALRALQADERTKRIPVIMLTSKRESKSILRAQELGAMDYLMKPISLRDLQKAVGGLLGWSGVELWSSQSARLGERAAQIG